MVEQYYTLEILDLHGHWNRTLDSRDNPKEYSTLKDAERDLSFAKFIQAGYDYQIKLVTLIEKAL